MQQILLNADGSLPAGIDLQRAALLGLRLVRPVDPPPADPGMMVVEGEPQLLGEVWWQVWTQVPAPAEPPLLPDLTRSQFAFLLALPPLRSVLEAVEAQIATTNDVLYAALQGYRARDVFPFALTMEIVAQFGPYLPPGVDLGAETITPLWLEAAAF
jgi:hypothetical protein